MGLLCNRTAVIKLNSQVARKWAGQLSRETGNRSPGRLADGKPETGTVGRKGKQTEVCTARMKDISALLAQIASQGSIKFTDSKKYQKGDQNHPYKYTHLLNVDDSHLYWGIVKLLAPTLHVSSVFCFFVVQFLINDFSRVFFYIRLSQGKSPLTHSLTLHHLTWCSHTQTQSMPSIHS